MLTLTILSLIALAVGWTYRAPGSEGRESLLLVAGLATVALVAAAAAMTANGVALSVITAHLNLLLLLLSIPLGLGLAFVLYSDAKRSENTDPTHNRTLGFYVGTVAACLLVALAVVTLTGRFTGAAA